LVLAIHHPDVRHLWPRNRLMPFVPAVSAPIPSLDDYRERMRKRARLGNALPKRPIPVAIMRQRILDVMGLGFVTDPAVISGEKLRG
jgi:hypothetical protein